MLAFHFVSKLPYKSPDFSSHLFGLGCGPQIPHECEQKVWPLMELLRELYCLTTGEIIVVVPDGYFVLFN